MILITNANLITWEQPNQVLEGQAILIEADRITAIAPSSELERRFPEAERLDAHGQYAMPGNICAHTHFYGAFARGLAIPPPAPKEFQEVLQKLWFPLDKSLTLEDVRYSALVLLIDAIKHGTTTLFDHHASPNVQEGSLDAIAEAVDQAGVRAVLCYEVTDRDGPDKAHAGITENLRFLQRVKDGALAGGRVAANFGLHASLTLSQDTLAACQQAAPAGIGFHIHVAEHEVDEYDSLAKTGTRVVDRLAQFGILGPKSIIVHAVHIDAREASLLAESGSWVTHQARSNMNNGVGVAQVESLLRLGVRMGIGTDGFSHTMWQEWKAAYLLQKVWHRDPRRMPADQVVQMGVYNNAALVGVYFPQAPIGQLIPGAFADLILVDYQPYTPLTPGNLPWQIIFGFQESMITTTMVAGKLLMHERKLLTLDEQAITARARQLAPAVWQRYQGYAPH